MNTQNPLVSVIIPCFNTAKYLPETLDSLFAQTLQDFEVIAVDDGSTDNRLDVLNRYQEKHANSTVISQKNSYCIIARMRLGMQRGNIWYVWIRMINCIRII